MVYPVSFNVDNEEGKTEVYPQGFPDAVKIIEIKGENAERASQLFLRRKDLLFAKRCLDEMKDSRKEDVILDALWKSAVITYQKCFKDSAVEHLVSFDEMYPSSSSDYQTAKELHEYFLELRRYHFAHDVNSMYQADVGAVLNPKGSSEKIGGIFFPILEVQSRDVGSVKNLSKLIEIAIRYLEIECDKVSKLLSEDLEKKDYDELMKMKSLKSRIPARKDIGKKRKSH